MSTFLLPAIFVGIAVAIGAATVIAAAQSLPTEGKTAAAIAIPVLSAIWTAIVGLAADLREAPRYELKWRNGLRPILTMVGVTIFSVVMILATSPELAHRTIVVWVIAMGGSTTIFVGVLSAGWNYRKTLYPEESIEDFVRPLFFVGAALMVGGVLFFRIHLHPISERGRVIGIGVAALMAVFGVSIGIGKAITKQKRISRRGGA